MSEQIERNMARSIELFHDLVEAPLAQLLDIEIKSIEEENVVKFKLNIDELKKTELFEAEFLKKLETLPTKLFVSESHFVEKIQEAIGQGQEIPHKEKLLQIALASSSKVSDTLDKEASSDLLFRFKNELCVYTAASRIFPRIDTELFGTIHNEPVAWPPSITIRHSKQTTQKKHSTEIDKLKAQYGKIVDKIPVICPYYLCDARIKVEKKETNIENVVPVEFHDIIVAETIPLIEVLLSTDSEKGINLPKLTNDFEKNKKELEPLHQKQKKQKKKQTPPSAVIKQPNKRNGMIEEEAAGIRGLSADGEVSFIFIKKFGLEYYSIPYFYRDKDGNFYKHTNGGQLFKKNPISKKWEICES